MRILIYILAVVVALIVVFAAFITGLIVIPKGTTLAVSPSNFTAESGSSMVLSAVLESGSFQLSGKTITWSASQGSFDKTAGDSVLFTAPAVVGNTSVTITISFGGDRNYVGSSATATALIIPAAAPVDNNTIPVEKPSLTNEYVLKFNSAEMHNVTLKGPVMVSGTATTKITCTVVNMSSPSISRIGLSGSSMAFTNVVMYVTYIEAYSPSLAANVKYVGASNVALGPWTTATFGNGTLYAVYVTSQTIVVTAAEVKGQHTGGTEPYVPMIFEVTGAQLYDNYGLLSEETYGDLVNRATKMVMGGLGTPGFSLVAPVNYALNRATMNYTYTAGWQMKTTNCTATKVLIYSIYQKSLAVLSPEIVLEFTGDRPVPYMYGFEKGVAATVFQTTAHLVYLSADVITMNDVTLSIQAPA